MEELVARHQPPAVALSCSGGGSGVGTPLADYESRTPESTVSIRIYVPELNIQKVLHFRQEELVWNVKQQCLATLPKELKESFNYGLFYPPSNGRAGKFLDDERPLSDYPFNGPLGYLELKYKRRVYKMLHLDEKQLRSLHTRVQLRRFLDYVATGQAEKITKTCAKGLDPNFHCQETGETPLTMAAVSSRPGPLLLALVGGGALLDYRTRCGSTALHRAAEKNNIEAVRTLLDLGASPGVRDGKGLTPLYNAILSKSSPMLCQALLHDYSTLGIQDAQGWHEVHQACRNGLVQHLENLLFYGADMNAKNASGNTPLHVCAVDNQEACARLLLFRGADRESLNFANQTPYQVAVIAGNLDLASLIHSFKTEEVVPYKEAPSYNPRRRKSVMSMRHSISSHRLESSQSSHCLSTLSVSSGSSHSPSPSLIHPAVGSGAVRVLPALPPPSPSPSDRWLELAPLSTSTASVRSDTGSSSSCTAESEDNASANGSSLTDKISVDQCDVVSDSSGVGTSNSGSGGSYDATPSEHSLVLPGMTVVCIEAYSSKEANHLQLQPGDIIEVTGSTDCGFLEGWLRGDSGYFPPSCVQEVRLRHPAAVAAARQHHSPLVKMPSSSPAATPTLKVPTPSSSSSLPPLSKLGESRIVGRRELSIQHYGTTPRMKSMYGEPRTVILHKGQRGFGFVLRGAKTTNSSNDWQPVQTRVPALQYLDSVEPDSVADRAGLRPGDFILAINGEDLAQASHETVVDAIRRSGNLVTITVCSAIKPGMTTPSASANEYAVTGNNSSRQYSTLPRKLSGRPPQPPKRDPRTTLSVGRARARSMVAGLTEMESSRSSTGGSGEEIYSNSTSRTASIRSRSGSGRVSSSDLERLSAPTAVAPPAPPSQQRTPRVYASVAEMKRMKKHKLVNELKLHKDFHSTPDLNWEQDDGDDIMVSSWTEGDAAADVAPTKEDWRKSQSQDDVYIFELQNQLNQRNSRHSWAFAAKNGNAPVAKAANGQGSRYHGSWQNIEQAYHSGVERPQAGEEEDPEDEETEEEIDPEDGEDATTPIVDQVSLIGHGDYRAVKPCRPVYSSGSNTLPKQRASSPHVPPPDHPPPPPPPPSQVVRVDVTNPHSEYAIVTGTPECASGSVMSSFRPTDSAKLYALPEDVESVGYSTLRPQSTKNSPNPATAAAAAAAAARSHSLPPRSVRPLISKTNGNLRNGKGGSLDESRVTLTINSSPVIPEPDYDVDDVDSSPTPPKGVLKSNSRPSGRDLSTFSPGGHHWKNSEKSEDADDVEHHPSVRIEIKQTGFNMPKSQSFCADILKAKSLLKTSQSFPEDLSEAPAKPANGSNSTEGTYVTFLPVNSEQSPADKAEPSNLKDRANRRNGNLTRHAVSLVQLPPPAENSEDPECSDVAERLLHESAEQDSVSTISTLSSLSTSSTSSDRDTTILESKPSSANQQPTEAVNPSWMAKEAAPSSDADRTIEESLQLIRMHVDALSDMKCLSPSKTPNAPMVPPPPEFEGQKVHEEFTSPFLPPPPPEFSDPEAALFPRSRMIPKSPSAGQLRSQFNHFGEDHYSSLSSRLLHLDGGPHRRMMERRLSDDAMAVSKPPTVRVVGAVPKKVSFSPDVIDNTETKEQAAAASIGKSFRSKVLQEWNVQDTADWLDSLFLSEYKAAFVKKSIDGIKLLHLNNDMLLSLGVKRVGHRLNMERSLKYYLHSSNAKPTVAPWSE